MKKNSHLDPADSKSTKTISGKPKKKSDSKLERYEGNRWTSLVLLVITVLASFLVSWLGG